MMLKKIAVPILLGGALVAFTAKAESARFSDHSGHWAKESIEIAVGKGYVDGYEDGTFRPDRQVSRAEFAKMAVTALKLPASGKTDGADWYLPYANAAVSAGIHRWSDFNNGDWNTPITRQEMARMVVRATDKELQKADVNKSDSELMYLATKAGLIQGLTGGELGVSEATTRAQSVTVIERILTKNSGGTLEVDKHAVNRAELAWHKTNVFTVMPQFFKNINPRFAWNTDNLFVETPDGYRGELDALIAIDLDDPADPHRYLLGDMNTLKWDSPLPNQKFPVRGVQDAYVLYFKGHEVYNNNPEVYVKKDYIPYNFTGFKLNREALNQGTLGAVAHVFHEKLTDVSALIIPKKIETYGDIYVEIYSPARANYPNYNRTILSARTGERIE